MIVSAVLFYILIVSSFGNFYLMLWYRSAWKKALKLVDALRRRPIKFQVQDIPDQVWKAICNEGRPIQHEASHATGVPQEPICGLIGSQSAKV